MSQLEEQILKQNVLEEHRQVHELQLRIKELRADVERYVAINAQQAERAEKAEAELAKLREQVPLTFVHDPNGYAIGGTHTEIADALPVGTDLYARPIPAPAVPRKYHEFATVMLDAQPFITAETYGGRYIVAMRFERLDKMQDCHAALLALLQSAHVTDSVAAKQSQSDSLAVPDDRVSQDDAALMQAASALALYSAGESAEYMAKAIEALLQSAGENS